MDNNEKTLKQLLTEPCRVQKKDGYCSYESFRKSLYLACLEFHKNGFLLLNKSPHDALVFLWQLGERLSSKESRLSSKELSELFFAKAKRLYNSILFLVKQPQKIFYLDKNLFEMLLQTEIPKNTTISHLVCEGYLLLLPKEVAHWGLLLFAQTYDDLVFCDIVSDKNTVGSLEVPLGHVITSDEVIQALDSPNVNNENKIAENFTRFVSNFLLWQQSMHEKGEDVIEIDAPTRKMGFGKKSKQIIIPRVIGEGYKPKVIRRYETTGTHASPRTHWRSGHWRQHMIGSRKNPEHKTIWIEPTLING